MYLFYVLHTKRQAAKWKEVTVVILLLTKPDAWKLNMFCWTLGTLLCATSSSHNVPWHRLWPLTRMKSPRGLASSFNSECRHKPRGCQPVGQLGWKLDVVGKGNGACCVCFTCSLMGSHLCMHVWTSASRGCQFGSSDTRDHAQTPCLGTREAYCTPTSPRLWRRNARVDGCWGGHRGHNRRMWCIV